MQIARAAALGVALVLTAPVAAEDQTARTGTGGGPLSTQRAPNTTAVGQTKPPSRDASPATTGSIERRTPQQRQDSIITKGICAGC
ncbi:conserved hypothetical protein [Methylobacterium nodulans ORS 2060]|uniref:Uncharacterized protein n=1 Tax=Methylobacterium nodulans (strain LMG 21967 / CNCM I-2342 / ORS 2060) TaxID=460265 RepID=B8IG01_METNO|nr:conserved hypothetical protein [Methylobacterium nodulans ORS 2060]